MKKLFKLLDKQYLTPDEIEELEVSPEVREVNNLGYSSIHSSYNWLDVVLSDGTSHNVYCKY